MLHASCCRSCSADEEDAGAYTVKIGASSEDIRQSASFTLAQDQKVATVHGPVR